MMKVMDIADSALIELAVDGDTAAFGVLVDRYKRALVRHCDVLVRDHDTAQDIAQDSFIDAYKYLRSYDSEKSKFSTWLFKIATNNALRVLKAGSRTTTLDEEGAHQLVSTLAGPDDRAVHNELRHLVSKLPDTYRAVISMYYWEGMSYHEVAAALGKPEGTIKGWLSRAKEQLRKELL